MLTVPVPQREPPKLVGAVGNAFTIVVILFEVAGDTETQAVDEVIITETTSLFANAVVV